MQHDVAVTVQTAGAISVHLAQMPGLAVPGFPYQRRILGINAHTLNGALQAQAYRAARHRIGEADDEGVVRLRDRSEGDEPPAALQLLGPVDTSVRTGSLGRDRSDRARHEVEVVDRREDDGFLGFRTNRRGLRVCGDALRQIGRRGEPEREWCPRRCGREQPDIDELQELHVEAVRDPVEPVQQLIGHPRERLDERDARVGDVVVGPLGTALLHHPFRLVHEVLETAVVEIGDGKCHASPSLGIV